MFCMLARNSEQSVQGQGDMSSLWVVSDLLERHLFDLGAPRIDQLHYMVMQPTNIKIKTTANTLL
jgi:hypothetical protein